MNKMIHGPNGSYNLQFVRQVRCSHDGKEFYAELDNGRSVQIYKDSYYELEEHDRIVPGNGRCRYFYLPPLNSSPDQVWQTPIWIETRIIAWSIDLGGEWHKPICIDQPDETGDCCTFVEDSGGNWVIIGDCRFGNWEKVEEYANLKFAKRLAEISSKQQKMEEAAR